MPNNPLPQFIASMAAASVKEPFDSPFQNWRLVMARLASGSHCVKNTDRWPNNVAGCTKQPTSWIKCPRACRAGPSSSFMRCISHRHAKALWQPTISLSPVTRPNIPKPPGAWKRTKNGCSLFTTFRRSIGPTTHHQSH